MIDRTGTEMYQFFNKFYLKLLKKSHFNDNI